MQIQPVLWFDMKRDKVDDDGTPRHCYVLSFAAGVPDRVPCHPTLYEKEKRISESANDPAPAHITPKDRGCPLPQVA
jgi:hypothetical protein